MTVRAARIVLFVLIAMTSVASAIALTLSISERHSMCVAVNRNSSAIRALIVQGAKDSKPFEKLYAQYGLPPYAVRVQKAREVARRFPALGECRVPPIR